MKNFIFLSIISVFIIFFISCKDKGSNPSTDSSKYKVKMTIYKADLTKDSNFYRKYAEFYFDGDLQKFASRNFFNKFGVSSYRGLLNSPIGQSVPLAMFNYGCRLKEIEFTNDTSYYEVSTYEYDSDGFLSKFNFDSYSPDNKSFYTTYQREGDKEFSSKYYQENVLSRITLLHYNSKGFVERELDSNVINNTVWAIYYHYNNLNQLDYCIMGKDSTHAQGTDTTNGDVNIYLYDNNGNLIKLIGYSKENGAPFLPFEKNWTVYNCYCIEPEKIKDYQFDSKNNIIGYIDNYHKKKYKIEYEFR